MALTAVVAVPALAQRAQATSGTVYQVGAPKSSSSSLATYTVYLMYNSCAGENFSLARVVITLYATPTSIQASVYRNTDGSDGGATGATETCGDIEHGFCGSQPVYSPHNTAYACVVDWNAPTASPSVPHPTDQAATSERACALVYWRLLTSLLLG